MPVPSPLTSSTPKPASCTTPLSDGQRAHDLDIASVNIAGELFDLEAAALLAENIEATDVADSVISRYEALWTELTRAEYVEPNEWWRIEHRLQRLNDLGYDVGEVQLIDEPGGHRLSCRRRSLKPAITNADCRNSPVSTSKKTKPAVC